MSAEGLADKLFGKKLITKDVLDETSLPSLTNTDKIRVLIRAVLNLVKIEPTSGRACALRSGYFKGEIWSCFI